MAEETSNSARSYPLTGMSRRQILEMLAAGVAISFLPGCGGGGGTARGSVQTAIAEGAIDQGAIGGTGLQAVSAWSGASSASGGSFQTEVSVQGAQLLSVIDDGPAIRGLTISVPEAGAPVSLMVDASTTVAAIVFMTPGIMECEPAGAREVLDRIAGLPSFQAAVARLGQILPVSSLVDALQDSEFDSRLEDCIEEWWPASAMPEIIVGAAQSGFGVNVLDASVPTQVLFEDSNAAWRYVCVQRLEFNAQDVLVNRKEVFTRTHNGPLSGAKPASWGTLLLDTYGDPTVAPEDETVNLDSIARAEYWVEGPGLAPGSLPLHPDVPSEWHVATGHTVVFCVIVPMVNIFLGAGIAVADALLKVKEVWDAIENAVSLNEMHDAVTEAEFLAALINLVASVIVAAVLIKVLVVLGLSTAAATAVAAIILGQFALVLGIANLAHFARNIAEYRSVTRIDVLSLHNPVLDVPRISAPPAIDGSLASDPDWSGANVTVVPFRRNSDSAVFNKTVYLAHDGTWLYIGVQSGVASAWDVWFGLYIDGNGDGQLSGTASQPSVDVHFATSSPNSWPGYQHHWFLGPNGTVGNASPPAGTAWVGANSADVAYEFKISLANLTAGPGDTVAIWFLNGVDGTGPGGHEFPHAPGVNIAQQPNLWAKLVLAP